MSNDVDLVYQLSEGRRLLQQDYRDEDKKKLGNLRAGNSGILNEQGEFAGSCPLEAYLRQLGVQTETHTNDKLIMFQMGVASEDVIARDLKRTLPANLMLKREEEIPIEWNTTNGTKVTGRPDIVICNAETGVPVRGLELKSVASIWTTCEVLFEGRPKLSHLIQAAHYAWKLNVPYVLMYKQYVNQWLPEWKLRQLPKLHEALRGCVEWKGNAVKQVVPFEIAYELQIDPHGQVMYRMANIEREWTRSIVNVRDIERFYEFVSMIGATGKLGSKLMTVDAVGNEKSYKHCDQYCRAHKLFGQFTGDYNEFMDVVQKFHEDQQLLKLASGTDDK